MIPFNKPYLTGKETHYMYQAVLSGKISGNGMFTQKCQAYFEKQFGFKKCLLTTSCTDALEMCAILADIKLGDEIIMPSYTFVSTALAFVRQGAKIVFVDSKTENPNLDEKKIEALITEKTKAIVPVHYAGIACEMDEIMRIANKYNLLVIEDAAQSIDSYFYNVNSTALGSIGHLATFSFHETKNIISGEGGMLVINDDKFIKRSEIIWEKGTNRAEFFRGEVNKYGWVDVGSSFLPSEIIAAFLWAQIENLEDIQNKRKCLWNIYYNRLEEISLRGKIKLPVIPKYASNNGHIFYIICSNLDERSKLIKHLFDNEINAVFHYLSLHKSKFYNDKHDGRILNNCDSYSDCLVRLPIFYELNPDEINKICDIIIKFYN